MTHPFRHRHYNALVCRSAHLTRGHFPLCVMQPHLLVYLLLNLLKCTHMYFLEGCAREPGLADVRWREAATWSELAPFCVSSYLRQPCRSHIINGIHQPDQVVIGIYSSRRSANLPEVLTEQPLICLWMTVIVSLILVIIIVIIIISSS